MLGLWIIIFLIGLLFVYCLIAQIYRTFFVSKTKPYDKSYMKSIKFKQNVVYFTNQQIPIFKSEENCFFDKWNDESQESQSQKTRIIRALKSKTNMFVNTETLSATVQSERDKNLYYQVCYDKCSCPDFLERNEPCKHMLRLACVMEDIIIDKRGNYVLFKKPKNDNSP